MMMKMGESCNLKRDTAIRTKLWEYKEGIGFPKPFPLARACFLEKIGRESEGSKNPQTPH
jgi:hypothetical protein